MAIREATEGDLDALLPLMRAYCDFYESSPSDDGLLEMARSSIAAPEDEAFLLVSTDVTAGWSASPTTSGSGRAFAAGGSSSSTTSSSPSPRVAGATPTP